MDKISLTKKKPIPIWFMRQAGRYLPEYRKIRKEKRNFLELCFTPDLATEISLQPIKRFNLDFIILFCDILVVPYCLGQNVEFREKIGPILNPISSLKDLNYKNTVKCLEKLNPVFETIENITKKKRDKQLIGFCGGPFTVLNYMIEGGTSEDHRKIKNFVKNQKKRALALIELITEISCEYLKKQIDKGVDFIQIFESWAGLLDGEDFNEYIVKPNKRISNEIRKYSKKTKIIHFPRGSNENLITFVNEVICDVISLDQNYPKEIIKIAQKKKMTIQGNLNPSILVQGGFQLEEKTKQILEEFKHNRHIFNLSHGVLPNTPITNIEQTINIVRNHETTK